VARSPGVEKEPERREPVTIEFVVGMRSCILQFASSPSLISGSPPCVCVYCVDCNQPHFPRPPLPLPSRSVVDRSPHLGRAITHPFCLSASYCFASPLLLAVPVSPRRRLFSARVLPSRLLSRPLSLVLFVCVCVRRVYDLKELASLGLAASPCRRLLSTHNRRWRVFSLPLPCTWRSARHLLAQCVIYP
jgi:hypothetical protein